MMAIIALKFKKQVQECSYMFGCGMIAIVHYSGVSVATAIAGVLGVPEKEQKWTKIYGRFPELKIFSGTNVLMILDSV
jgi:hypothetical protein